MDKASIPWVWADGPEVWSLHCGCGVKSGLQHQGQLLRSRVLPDLTPLLLWGVPWPAAQGLCADFGAALGVEPLPPLLELDMQARGQVPNGEAPLGPR